MDRFIDSESTVDACGRSTLLRGLGELQHAGTLTEDIRGQQCARDQIPVRSATTADRAFHPVSGSAYGHLNRRVVSSS
jgi:hypothetical protein